MKHVQMFGACDMEGICEVHSLLVKETCEQRSLGTRGRRCPGRWNWIRKSGPVPGFCEHGVELKVT
jgi:hypothetical protein